MEHSESGRNPESIPHPEDIHTLGVFNLYGVHIRFTRYYDGSCVANKYFYQSSSLLEIKKIVFLCLLIFV
jgi:hypothetical protein